LSTSWKTLGARKLLPMMKAKKNMGIT
jgi:hypothetical protein